MDVVAGTSAKVVIPLMEGDYPAIPDENTVTYTVFDHDGVPIPSLVDVPVPTAATTQTLVVTIDAPHNTVAAEKVFERRRIVGSYISNGIPKSFTTEYRVTPFLNHSVTPESIRNFTGLNKRELPDDDIDLLAAYITVSADFETREVSLADALASGTIVEVAANECIKMMAILNLIPSLRQRVAQSEADGVFEFSRPTISDFTKMESEVRGRYESSLNTATDSTGDALTLVLTTTDSDAITGE